MHSQYAVAAGAVHCKGTHSSGTVPVITLHCCSAEPVQQATAQEEDLVSQHALKLEQLQHLAQSPELQLMLKDERLQELMLKIDGAPNREVVRNLVVYCTHVAAYSVPMLSWVASQGLQVAQGLCPGVLVAVLSACRIVIAQGRTTTTDGAAAHQHYKPYAHQQGLVHPCPQLAVCAACYTWHPLVVQELTQHHCCGAACRLLTRHCSRRTSSKLQTR